MDGNQYLRNVTNCMRRLALINQPLGAHTHFESPSLRDRLQYNFYLYLAIIIFSFSVLVCLSGCNPQEVNASIEQDSSVKRSIQEIHAVYAEQGISGVSGEVLDCYNRADKSAPGVKRQRQVQHCISIDWAGYQLDSWASAVLKTSNIPFFHEDSLNERVRAFLPLSGLTEKEVEYLTFAIDDLLKSKINEANK